MSTIISKQLIDNLVTATINGAENVFVELFGFNRLEQGLRTERKEFWVHIDEGANEKRKELIGWLESRGYIKTLIGMLTWFVLPGKEGIPKAIVTISDRFDNVSGDLFGDPDEGAAISEYVERFKTKREGMFINIAQQGRGMFGNGVHFEREFVPNEELELASQSFYPWMPVKLEDYFKAYWESKQSVLILIGDPGTGKSTLIRTFFKWVHDNHKESCILAVDDDVVGDVGLVNSFFRSNNSVLAYEDMDAQLAKRTEGNKFMATLLNQTNGVVRRNQKKLIFSTNLQNTKSIDEALMRKGRCFDILEFSRLRPADAQVIAEERNLPARDFSGQESWSLAEVLVHEDGPIQTTNRFGRKIGFNS